MFLSRHWWTGLCVLDGLLAEFSPGGSELTFSPDATENQRVRPRSASTFAHPDLVLWGSVDFPIGDGNEFLLSLA